MIVVYYETITRVSVRPAGGVAPYIMVLCWSTARPHLNQDLAERGEGVQIQIQIQTLTRYRHTTNIDKKLEQT